MATTDTQGDTKQHLSDMVALQKHIFDAVEHQLNVEAVKNDPDAFSLLSDTRTILVRHIEETTAMVERQDAKVRTSLKALFTGFLGDIAGLYNNLRSDGAARAVRDTYTALSLASASLTALKTFGLIVAKEDISKLAYEHMRDIHPLIIKFSHRMPYIVARETCASDGIPYDPAIPERVEKATQRIWKGED